MSFEINPNFTKKMIENIFVKQKEVVETVFCIEHNQFASAIIDYENSLLKIQYCCEAQHEKSLEALELAFQG